MSTSFSSPLTFALQDSSSSSSSTHRVGLLSFTRPSDGTHLEIETPGLILNLDRGVVPYLSTDNRNRSDLPCLVHTSLDTTLHLPTPLSTLLPSSTSPLPLHTHLLLPPSRTLLSLSLLNPSSHLLPGPSQTNLLSTITPTGLVSTTPKAYYASALALKPDILWAAVDTRAGINGGSRREGEKEANGLVANEGKRGEKKGVERSLRWVKELVEEVGKTDSKEQVVLWTELVGGSDPFARRAFARGLVAVDPSSTSSTSSLDSHLSGYTLPLPTLRTRLSPSAFSSSSPPPSKLPSNSSNSSTHHPLPSSSSNFLTLATPLLTTSLSFLPPLKPRYAPSALSPHEILGLIGDVGVDLFDATLAYEATEMGVALGFEFPLPEGWEAAGKGEKEEVGISLYDEKWEMCFEPLGGGGGGVRSLASNGGKGVSGEGAKTLVHCSVSEKEKEKLVVGEEEKEEPLTKAYVHHLLMAHELLAPILLQSHNLSHLHHFLSSIRSTLLLHPPSVFERERARFEAYYSSEMGVLLEGRKVREGVRRERGKGSMGKDRSAGGAGKEGSGSGSGSE